MDRHVSQPRDERQLPSEPRVLEHLPRGAPDQQNAEVRKGRNRPESSRRSVVDRGRAAWRLTDREKATVLDIGSFRTVAVQDLCNHKYQGKSSEMEKDLETLIARGLVQKRTALTAQGRGRLVLCVLTKAGRSVAERLKNGAQEVYSGFVKPAEAPHDAAIYRMFHKEAARIEAQGGKIRRVVLDYELKRKVYRPLAKFRLHLATQRAAESRKEGAPLQQPGGPTPKAKSPSLRLIEADAAAYAKKQMEVAKANGLKVVNGKIPLPDLRIEYVTARGEVTKIDLELATRHYHGAHLSLKAEAGFQVYMAETSGGHMVRDERELTAEILNV